MNNSPEYPDCAQKVIHPRRKYLLNGFAVAAALGGFALAWKAFRISDEPEFIETGFWKLEFETPGGQRLQLNSLRGKPLLLNFWATWCPPCIEELPLLNAFYRMNSGSNWQVLGLAIDEPGAVQRFLARNPVAFPIALAGASAIGVSKSLGNPSGALPFTVLINAAGQIVRRKIGRLSSDDLSQWWVNS